MRIFSIILCLMLFTGGVVRAEESTKTKSVLYPSEIIEKVQQNVVNDPWAASIRDTIVKAAQPWRDMSDDALWDLMFGNTLPRSWMVWSNGYSPVTGEPVPMYNWKMDALGHPWKVQDPHSGEWFPKNDFKAYYDSGLDPHGVFDESKADRSLLFNVDHPDPNDPRHMFGVDDGHGYINEKGERWLFIATYLVYGQWKQGIVNGVRNLGAAYVMTGDVEYAHKAGVMLDRIADVHTTFDFGKEGVMYEGPGRSGYVSTWHDACEETRELIMAYDMVFEALKDDQALVDLLARKSKQYDLKNAKKSFADVQRNIEDGLLRDALDNPEKVYSNYPRTEILKAIIIKVLQSPEAEFDKVVDAMLTRATAVDGVTGEKGLAGYTSFTIGTLAMFLAEMSKADPDFLPTLVKRHPDLKNTYRFHIDTMCLDRYYPQSGDCGYFAGPWDRYVGMAFAKPGASLHLFLGWTALAPSMHRFLWDLYKVTGDAAYVQTAYRQNKNTVAGLPYDLFSSNPEWFRKDMQAVIDDVVETIALSSVNKEKWHLGILRSGEGENRRATWLDYDSGGGHGHLDALNLGLFAHGLDLLPDFGYPPVQFGGWGSPHATWYKKTSSHNTVIVDRENQSKGNGETTLWVDEGSVRAIRAKVPSANNGHRYERTVVQVDVAEDLFYIVDVFRVEGGKEHTKFVQGHFGAIDIDGLSLNPAEDFGHDAQIRNIRMDKAAKPGWRAKWAIDDRYKLLPKGKKVGMLYYDFTTDADAGQAEAWVVEGSYNSMNEAWVPRLMIQRKAEGGEPLKSTFVSVYIPFEGDVPAMRASRIADGVDKRGLTYSENVALQIFHLGGGFDLLTLADMESKLSTDKGMTFHRYDSNGKVVEQVD